MSQTSSLTLTKPSIADLGREWTKLQNELNELELRDRALSELEEKPRPERVGGIPITYQTDVALVSSAMRPPAQAAYDRYSKQIRAWEDSNGRDLLEARRTEINFRCDAIRDQALATPASSFADIATLLDIVLEFDVDAERFPDDRRVLTYLISELGRLAPEAAIGAIERQGALGQIDLANLE